MVGHRIFTDQLARKPPNYLLNRSRMTDQFLQKNRYTLIEQSATLIEQSNSFLKGVPKRLKKAKKSCLTWGIEPALFSEVQSAPFYHMLTHCFSGI